MYYGQWCQKQLISPGGLELLLILDVLKYDLMIDLENSSLPMM